MTSPVSKLHAHGEHVVKTIAELLKRVTGERTRFCLFTFGSGTAGEVGVVLGNADLSAAVANVRTVCDNIDRGRHSIPLSCAQAVRDVVDERVRQAESEGYDSSHDDTHPGEMGSAAACYALVAGCSIREAAQGRPMSADQYAALPMPPGPFWPWETPAWKPKNPRRDLVRAAALILAEIERIDRAAAG